MAPKRSAKDLVAQQAKKGTGELTFWRIWAVRCLCKRFLKLNKDFSFEFSGIILVIQRGPDQTVDLLRRP